MKKNLFFKNKLVVNQKLKSFESLVLAKSISQNFCLGLDYKKKLNGVYLALYFLNKKKKKSVSSITSQCFLTWRSGSTYSFFRLTRLTLREKFSFGEIKGLRKSSW